MIRYEAEFLPQVWIGDYAVTANPQGETTWDATEFVAAAGPAWLAQTMENGHDDVYGHDLADVLRTDPNAPMWVREWTGPFETYLRRLRVTTDYHLESRFSNLQYKAQLALEELDEFWTTLYGPNEALTAAYDTLDAMQDEFNASDREAMAATLTREEKTT